MLERLAPSHAAALAIVFATALTVAILSLANRIAFGASDPDGWLREMLVALGLAG